MLKKVYIDIPCVSSVDSNPKICHIKIKIILNEIYVTLKRGSTFHINCAELN